MIKPTQNPIVQIRATVIASDLTTLISAVSSSGVIALPEGKTLEDVISLNLNILPAPDKEGNVAIINAALK